MPWLPNVAQKYFGHDHVRGNGAENFDCILCYDMLSANVILSETDMFTRFKMIQLCLEIFGLSLFMDYDCCCCCCYQFQREFCTNTTGRNGNNLEVILKFVCYKYDDS